MENFSRYFRRLVAGNSPQIFPGTTRNVENPANYPILVREMDKIKTDPMQAQRIADAMDAAEGELARDFDLAIFVRHFSLDPFATTLLCSAFKFVTRPELRDKAQTLLTANLRPLLDAIAGTIGADHDASNLLIFVCAVRYLENDELALPAKEVQEAFQQAVQLRVAKSANEIADEFLSIYSLIRLSQVGGEFLQLIRRAGPPGLTTNDAAQHALSSIKDKPPSASMVASALLYIVLYPDWQGFDVRSLTVLIDSKIGAKLDWNQVLLAFDRPLLTMTKEPFLRLYNAILAISHIRPRTELQSLWLGSWKHEATQLSFLHAFLACTPADIDVSELPGFRRAFEAEDILEGSEIDKDFVTKLNGDPMISIDAVETLLNICLPAETPPNQQSVAELVRVIDGKVGLFLCTACHVRRTRVRQQLMQSLMQDLIKRKMADYAPYLRLLWHLDKKLAALSLSDAHLEDPLELTSILDLALELGWLKDLLTLTTGFAFDLVALAHRKGLVDFKEWANSKMHGESGNFVNALSRFVVIKAQDELRIARDEQLAPRTVGLTMQTAYDMLTILDEHMQDRTELKAIQRTFLQAYPRLILLCEGVREDIDVDCTSSNAMPRSADAEMQELYKKMYGKELDVSGVIEYLGKCKDSKHKPELDLFACMIHGLFDEYPCFSEYPLGPLQMTALLFGGMIKVGLISDLTLSVAREMVLDSVAENPPEASMFKFGLQALATFQNRLAEPDWSEYCNSLLKISNLQNTQIRARALEIVRQGTQGQAEAGSAMNGANFEVDLYQPAKDISHFSSVCADPESELEEPTDAIKDKIVFFFNNVTEQNLENKSSQLNGALGTRYRPWFAYFLVSTRAMLEPNYQPLYLKMLYELKDPALWECVLSSTYHMVRRVINANSILESVSERKNLKSLAIWLGSLTLARDKPVKRRFISFLDLLIEGLRKEKLVLVIPFTCNVLAQGKKSTIFRPPNPWIMEIVEALVELYRSDQISTNQKFDIEVVCDELDIDVKTLETSSPLRARMAEMELARESGDAENHQLHEDESVGAVNGAVLRTRFDGGLLQFELPDLEHRLVFPPAHGSTSSQMKLREIVVEAVTHAIYDIIGSVVERSVTIAAIATSQLVHKDFACEPSEDRLQRALQHQVRQLASSLALVTAREPLKTSMTSFIRKTQAEMPEYAFPEGTILMCVNDNLDVACRIVEEQAADQSQLEITPHIEHEIALRQRHFAKQPNEPYIGPGQSHWATLIQERFRIAPSLMGLSDEQISIYSDFGRQSRGQVVHGQSASGDSGRQLPDVLQEPFSSLPPVSASNDLAVHHQALASQQYQQHQQHSHRGQALPLPLSAANAQTMSNGQWTNGSYPNASFNPVVVEDRILDSLAELSHVIKQFENLAEPEFQQVPAVADVLGQLWDFASSNDQVAMMFAETICKSLFQIRDRPPREMDLITDVLARLCQSFPSIAREVAQWTETRSSLEIMNVDVTVELIVKRLMQTRDVDHAISASITKRDSSAIAALEGIIDRLLLDANPSMLRADFAKSLGALAEWHATDESVMAKSRIWTKLANVEEPLDCQPEERAIMKKHHVNYIFCEWIRLCEENATNPTNAMFAAFISQLHFEKLLHTPQDMALFLRIAIDAATMTFELTQQEEQMALRFQKDYSCKMFHEIDWLARLIVHLVQSASSSSGVRDQFKSEYLHSILSIVTLIMNHHQVTRGERFNQRIFFRLFSTMLCLWHTTGLAGPDEQCFVVFAQCIRKCGPRYFPGFTHSWLNLISHRFLMPILLKSTSSKVLFTSHISHPAAYREGLYGANYEAVQAHTAYSGLISEALHYIPRLLDASDFSATTLELFQGLFRLVVLLHHDFPNFLASCHYDLCNATPWHHDQLLNTILSASSAAAKDPPNPFTKGLRIDRPEEFKDVPSINGDFQSVLSEVQVLEKIGEALDGRRLKNEDHQAINDALMEHDEALDGTGDNQRNAQSFILFVLQKAIAAGPKSTKRVPSFNVESSAMILLTNVLRNCSASQRDLLIKALVNQLRWPNAHTDFVAHAILHFFSAANSSVESQIVKEQIITVLLKRLHCAKPHPWGLVVVMLELMKTSEYGFWQLPFINGSQQIQSLCEDLFKQNSDRSQTR